MSIETKGPSSRSKPTRSGTPAKITEHRPCIANQQDLRLEWITPDNIKPDPANSRHHSPQQIRKIADDIRRNGFTNPVLVTRDGLVVAGHARLEASKLLQLAQVPIIRLDLSPAQAKARNIWDNRSSDLSRFDNVLLGNALTELIDLDINIEDTGFSVGECDILIHALGASEEFAEAEILPVGPEVSAVGDLWTLGAHRVFCGDAESARSFESLMDGEAAHAVFTDVPYNRKASDISGKSKAGPRAFKMASGELSPQRYRSFLASSINLMVRHSVDGSLHYHCIDWRHLEDLQKEAGTLYASLINICVWVKPNGGMGSLYRSRHELVLVFKNGSSKHRNNVQLGQFGRNRTNVWEYAGGTTLGGRTTDEGNLQDLHPTVKPVQMVLDAILDCTARGEIVLDPFLGSGSTLIAAERAGRRCFGLDIDPQYVDVAIRRWQRHTGEHAVHAVTGKRFDDIAASTND